MKLPSKKRALRILPRAGVLTMAMTGLAACAAERSGQGTLGEESKEKLGAESLLGPEAESASAEPVDLAQAAVTLERLGFGEPHLEQVGSQIVINGDMVVEASTLQDWPNDTRNKGYYHPGIATPSVSDVCVQLVPGWLAGPDGAEMPFEWAWAFLFAAAEWNDRTDVYMRWAALGDPTCGQVIQLKYVTLYNSDGTRNASAYAQGLLPTGDGKPGKTLVLNRAFNGDNCNGSTGNINTVPWAEKMRVALHEIGHTLGFRHPQDNYWGFALLGLAPQHIAGTQAVAGTDWEKTYSYPSVMHTALCIGGRGGAGVGSLSADDINSANRKFP